MVENLTEQRFAAGVQINQIDRAAERASERLDQCDLVAPAQRPPRMHSQIAVAIGTLPLVGARSEHHDRAHHRQRRECDFDGIRSEENTSELQSLMRNSYAVFCLKKKQTHKANNMKPTT